MNSKLNSTAWSPLLKHPSLTLLIVIWPITILLKMLTPKWIRLALSWERRIDNSLLAIWLCLSVPIQNYPASLAVLICLWYTSSNLWRLLITKYLSLVTPYSLLILPWLDSNSDSHTWALLALYYSSWTFFGISSSMILFR